MKHSLWIRILPALCALAMGLCGCSNRLAEADADTSEEETKGIRCTLTVLDSVGGSRISEPTELSVYDPAGKKLYSQKVVDGKAALPLLQNKSYTFKLAGKRNKLAASAVENYRFKSDKAVEIVMFQRTPQKEAPTIAPTVLTVQLNGGILQDGGIFSAGVGKMLSVTMNTPSRAIRSSPQNRNFGCAFAIGTVPSALNNIAATDTACERLEDGSWRCTANFKLDTLEPTNETADLIIVAYDVAGNRIERHINDVSFQQNYPAQYNMNGVKIENFSVEIARHPQTLGLFQAGMEKQEGRSTSVEAKLLFRVKRYDTNLAIRGFDIFRRQQKAGQQAGQNWVLVGRKKYNGEFAGITKVPQGNEQYLGTHEGYDTDPTLTEGVTYEYKVKIYTDSTQSLESPIATARILSAFTIHLESPTDNSAVKQSDTENLEFSFKISNPSVIKAADYFTFGLLISEKSANSTVVFAGKARIMLKEKDPQRKLYFLYLNKYHPLDYLQEKKVIPKNITADSLLTLDEATGTVTLKKTFLRTKVFNMAKNAEEVAFRTGLTYNWDIIDWGKDAAAWRDDQPAAFTAAWPTRSANGTVLPESTSYSDSFANHQHSYSAINGKVFFKVTDN